MELATINSEITMSSIEIVDLINQERKAEAERNPGQKYIELRHDTFMAKVPKVLGENRSPEFSGDYKDSKNRTYKCYYLPQREAFLMVMSESYELQAKLYDAYESLKNKPKSFISLQEGIQIQVAQMQIQIIELQKQFSETNSNLIALLNNLAIKNEPKIETKPYFQPSGNNANNIDLHLYYRIVNYAKKFRTDLDLDIVRERAKEIGMAASRISKERKIKIHEEENLDSRYPGKTRYYHQDILEEVFRLLF